MNVQAPEKPKARKEAEAEAKEPKPKSYEAFLTRPRHNEGVVVFLLLPDGSKSDKWVRVVGEDSDIFREGHANLLRLAIREGDSEDSDKPHKSRVVELLADCIIDWNFEEELTREEKVNLIRNAPKIFDKVNETITSQSLFIKKKPTP